MWCILNHIQLFDSNHSKCFIVLRHTTSIDTDADGCEDLYDGRILKNVKGNPLLHGFYTTSIFKAQPKLRLNSQNYMCWGDLILQKVEAYHVATGEEALPNNASSAAQRDCFKRAATGLDVILSACTTTVAVQIGTIESLPEVWGCLRARCRTKDSIEARMVIKNSFERCTPQGCEKSKNSSKGLADSGSSWPNPLLRSMTIVFYTEFS